MNSIEINNFSKSFGDLKVIKDLSFEVEEGEIFAFLGANGSGKTTTIRCLLDIYQPNSGELFIFGQKYSPEIASKIGYLPEERGLYVSAQVIDVLTYFGELKGMSKNDARASGLKFLERVGLPDKANEKIQKLSSGQQQKIQLGITVINSPELLILDEPTKGLDPVNRSLLMEILFDLNKHGSTIVFSTHQMDEVEKIANRLVMINKGERALYGKLSEVKKEFGDNSIEIRFEGKLPENAKLFAIEKQGNTATLTPKQKVSHEEILQYLLSQNLKIQKFEISSPSLNDIFIKVVEE